VERLFEQPGGVHRHGGFFVNYRVVYLGFSGLLDFGIWLCPIGSTFCYRPLGFDVFGSGRDHAIFFGGKAKRNR
jgi:hypothetical protein